MWSFLCFPFCFSIPIRCNHTFPPFYPKSNKHYYYPSPNSTNRPSLFEFFTIDNYRLSNIDLQKIKFLFRIQSSIGINRIGHSTSSTLSHYTVVELSLARTSYCSSSIWLYSTRSYILLRNHVIVVDVVVVIAISAAAATEKNARKRWQLQKLRTIIS